MNSDCLAHSAGAYLGQRDALHGAGELRFGSFAAEKDVLVDGDFGRICGCEEIPC